MTFPKRDLQPSKWGRAFPNDSSGREFLIHDDFPDMLIDISDLGEFTIHDAYPATEPEHPIPQGYQRIQREGFIIIIYPSFHPD